MISEQYLGDAVSCVLGFLVNRKFVGVDRLILVYSTLEMPARKIASIGT